MSIHDQIREKVELAAFVADDGAFFTCSRMLRELADEVEAHARNCNALLNGHRYAEEDCPGHVASRADRAVCGRCGVHIDDLRPDDPCDPINLAGSGPVPVEPREG